MTIEDILQNPDKDIDFEIRMNGEVIETSNSLYPAAICCLIDKMEAEIGVPALEIAFNIFKTMAEVRGGTVHMTEIERTETDETDERNVMN